MTGFDGKGLGKKVRRVRLMRGLTLKQIEAAVGVSATHVSEIERGKTSPTIGALGKIADALGVGVACLIEPYSEPGIYTSSAADRTGYSLSDGKLVLRPLSNGFHGSELTMMATSSRTPFFSSASRRTPACLSA